VDPGTRTALHLAPRLSLRDAADELQVSLPTLWRWITPPGVKGAVLMSVLIGGRRYVLRADLDRFLAQLQEVTCAS
jgi:hypothetical protein